MLTDKHHKDMSEYISFIWNKQLFSAKVRRYNAEVGFVWVDTKTIIPHNPFINTLIPDEAGISNFAIQLKFKVKHATRNNQPTTENA